LHCWRTRRPNPTNKRLLKRLGKEAKWAIKATQGIRHCKAVKVALISHEWRGGGGSKNSPRKLMGKACS